MITVMGNNFWGPTGLRVTFGGVDGTVVALIDSQTIQVVTPPYGGTADPPVTVNVVVINPDGRASAPFDGFTYEPAPPPHGHRLSPFQLVRLTGVPEAAHTVFEFLWLDTSRIGVRLTRC